MTANTLNPTQLANQIKEWGNELGFQQIGITDTDLQPYQGHFLTWLEKQFHGEMDYMLAHGSKRYHPEELVPGTIRVITARIDYLPPDTHMVKVLQNPEQGYISRYALGRDYHKLIRKRLQQLAEKIATETHPFGYRTFADSAPVLEKPLAEKSGLGWIGKHTNLLNRQAGSWFFLGEIYTDLPLPIDEPVKNHCGTCRSCIDVCPTQAIVAPYQLDARRCISYLTIELRGSIPEELRPLIGNRIYGCDDCQLFCPWNRFAKPTDEKDFHPRHQLAEPQLIDLFLWTEDEFLTKTAGSAIRRIGYECWLRNIAVALGNAPADEKIVPKIQKKKHDPSPLVKEHVEWALKQQRKKT
jgi:epoxyqueuosine reductase